MEFGFYLKQEYVAVALSECMHVFMYYKHFTPLFL